VTELEAFRKAVNAEGEGPKLTMLAFVVKACVVALKRHPHFNASLEGEEVVLKRYYHIGVAADTPGGLVVPVVRDADAKGVHAIAGEMAALAAEARAGRLRPEQMQGASFTISSLGGVGGTGFTPIINAPEVAILGLVPGEMQPVWDGEGFRPRLIQPLSLSWDHRVVDGVQAARFLVTVRTILSDFRRIGL
jgi:pyruvate dehydrogenase E2 component (dihydrolipoamide acetyltransferase)